MRVLCPPVTDYLMMEAVHAAGGKKAAAKASCKRRFCTYHDGEDDGQEGGFEDPENSQAYNLDESEEMNPPQRNVAEIAEVWLVLGWHQEQLDPVPELRNTAKIIHKTCQRLTGRLPSGWFRPEGNKVMETK